MLLELCVVTILETGVSLSKGTVGILGYRQSLLGHAVIEIHSGSPVEGLLHKGDKVLAIDGDSNRHETRGEPGTKVILTVKRGDRVFDVSVCRIAVQNLHDAYLCHYFGVTE